MLALFSYLGYQLRTIPTIIYAQIRKLIIYSVHIESRHYLDLFSYFEIWLAKYHERCFKNVKASLTHDSKKFELNHYTDIFILKYKGKRLLITKGREKFENASDIRNAFHNNFSAAANIGVGNRDKFVFFLFRIANKPV